MRIHPYLNFDGNAKEAMEFYAKVFGVELGQVNYFKDMPPQEGVPGVPEEEANRVMHVGIEIAPKTWIMASDTSPARGHRLTYGNNNYIMIEPDNLDEAKRLFEELSEGGEVEMELQKMFWGDYFASFKDKFGVLWMINLEDRENK
jgi:PhnB protein